VPRPTVLDAYNDADVVVIAWAISVEKVSDQLQTPSANTAKSPNPIRQRFLLDIEGKNE